MKRSVLIALLLFLIGPGPILSQLIPFDNYSVNEKAERKRLPGNFIYDIEQDQLGYLWLGTQAGAIRYDGYNFHQLTIQNGLPDNEVIEIFIDSRNRIWIATRSGGLAMLEKNRLEFYNAENGLVSDNSIEVLEDNKGNIWYSTYDGISIIQADTIINFHAENSDIQGQIFALELGMDGKVWFSTINSLYYYDSALHKVEDPLLGTAPVLDIKQDKLNSIWLGTQGRGVIHITDQGSFAFNTLNYLVSDISTHITALGPDTVLVTTSFPGGIYLITNGEVSKQWTRDLSDFSLREIVADSKGRIWIGTVNNGILLLDQQRLLRIGKENSLVSNNIHRIIEDTYGNIWIGTPDGISKYGKVVFEIYRDGLINDEIWIQRLAEINGEIYMGTGSGLNILDPEGEIRWIDQTKGPFPAPDPAVYSILEENPNVSWLATWNGISRLMGDKTRFVSYAIQFPSEEEEFTLDMVMLRDRIFCATSRGLVTYDRNRFALYTTEDGLSDNYVVGLAVDPQHNVWCATDNGISIYDGISFHNYSVESGLSANTCNDIVFDSEGKAWIATAKGVTVVTLNPDWTISCRIINTGEYQTTEIFLILIDKQGFVWMGHADGLDRLDPDTGEIIHYSSMEGFEPRETSLGAAITTSGGDLWFGTVKGAVRYLPENDFINYDPPKVYLDTVYLYNDSTDISKYAEYIDSTNLVPAGLSLPYNKNNLIFRYVGLHYTIIEKNSYKYMLEGYDSDWSGETQDIITPPYRKIPPGRYTFKVLAANCDGIWTDQPAEFSFEIRPPFYRTWWAYTLEALLGIFLLVLFIRLRERKLRQDKEILTQKVKERTLEIEKQRDQIAYQKKEITDSILYAEKIQTAVLPKNEYIDKLLKDYFILFKPRDIVSGDFYWISGKNGKVIVVAADCTGHGVPGAFMSMLGVSILNELASSREDMTSDLILNILRDHLTKTLRQTGKEEDAKDGMDLALCILDFSQNLVQFSGAYNPLLHIRESECTVYKGDKMPVGMHPGDIKPFTAQQVRVQKGDCIYMFSDGYADQFGGPDDKKFKSSNLRELLVNNYYLPMEEQKIRLNETIDEWRGISEQVDDILVIGIRI